ncbi:MAG: HD-GYP domain-containing protein, partial [Actinomycetota bacterium]|nr:HD-GYP domain-containing protein [Actinomycetota bacterium]
MHIPQADRDRLRWAALLHDVGKLHVPSRILNKPGKPTEKEWEQLRSHPMEGAKIAAPLAGWLGPWADAIGQHHERWDGGGYPSGLSGEDISLAARIVAVADTFEVITAPRPYKRPVNAEAARQELARCAGSHFDPAVVRAFLNISIGRLRMAMGPVSWLAQLPFLGSVPRLEGLALAAGRSAATAAGTATGVGALALTGMVGSASTAASDSASVHTLRDAARTTEQVQAGPSASPATTAAAAPSPASAPAGDEEVAAPEPEPEPERVVQRAPAPA